MQTLLCSRHYHTVFPVVFQGCICFLLHDKLFVGARQLLVEVDLGDTTNASQNLRTLVDVLEAHVVCFSHVRLPICLFLETDRLSKF